uniref:Uncharacterized protein n=1 Tax=Haptolina ericina TaxID=156174 RepID=A0A7S3BCI5_9EUKA
MRSTEAWTLPKFRMLSIDGCHLQAVAFSDLRWADARLADGGVVVLDDVMHPGWFGVSRGLRDFYHLLDRHHERLRPLLLTTKKMYLVRPAYHERYLRALCELQRTGRGALQRLGQVPVPSNGAIWNKLTTLPIDFVGHALTLTDPLWTNEPIAREASNATEAEALRDQVLREPEARQRRLGVERLLVGLPSPPRPYHVAVTKQMLAFLLTPSAATNVLPAEMIKSAAAKWGHCTCGVPRCRDGRPWTGATGKCDKLG